MLDYLTKNTDYKPDSGGTREAWLFGTASDLINEKYLPPASLAALFDALSRIPGITVTRKVTDAAGRSGIAVGYTQRGFRNEIVFDTKTYAFLARRAVAVPSGNVDYEMARLRIAVVDRAGTLP
jgi:hypothetical protein